MLDLRAERARKLSFFYFVIFALVTGGVAYWLLDEITEGKQEIALHFEHVKKDFVVRSPKSEGASALVVPIDTSTWKTYRNDEYGFEVKYPPSWVLVGELSAGRARPSYARFQASFLTDSPPQSFAVSVARNNPESSLDEYINQYFEDFQSEAFRVEDFRGLPPMQVDKIKVWSHGDIIGRQVSAKQYLPTGKLSDQLIYVFLPIHDSVFIFKSAFARSLDTFLEDERNSEFRLKRFDTILSTFKFTK